MAEEHPEELTETITEAPVSEHEAAVAAAVPLDDLILRILDEQTALAEQQRRILDELRRLDDSGDIADQLRAGLDGQRTLQHDVTVLCGLLPTVAHAQTAILDQITALAAGGARLDNREVLNELRSLRDLLDRDGDRVTRLEGDPYLNLLGRRKVIGTICSMPGTYPLAYMSPDTWIDNTQAFDDDPFGLLSYPLLDGTGRPVDPYQPTEGRYPAELAADEVAHGAQSRDRIAALPTRRADRLFCIRVWPTAPLVP
jgi:hypothetical protein